MIRHERTCTSETRFKFHETEYGNPDSVREQLEQIRIVDPDFEMKFVSYDIETIPCKEESDGRIYIVQKPISIAYFDGENGDVFIGENLVARFLEKMEEIQVLSNKV